jgi:hypothetical protein
VIGFNGNAGSPEHILGLKQDYHNAFGMKLAREGYMVYVPYLITDEDLRRRLDNRAVGVGMRLVGLEIGIAMRALDYLASRKDVNPAGINVFGISNGGLLSSYLGAADPRINVTVQSGAFAEPKSYFKVYADDNPAYYRYNGDETVFTRATIPYLIAPRPFFVEYGAQDFLVPFRIGEAFAGVRQVYQRLGVEDRAGIGASQGGHQVYLKGSLDFLKQWSPPAVLR